MTSSSDVPTTITSAEAISQQPSLRAARHPSSMLGAVIAGFAAAVVGAAVWAAITAFTGYQIGFMAIGVGFLVGIAVRWLGHGRTAAFGIVGAVFALLGCAAGNLLAGCIILAQAQEIGVLEVIEQLDIELAGQLMSAMFSPMDLLFYGLAIVEGYKLSFEPEGE